jgi:ATP-binding cassette subfamily B protein
MDCGPTCLRMVAKFHGKSYSLPFLREKCYIDREGVSIKGIIEAAELIGFRVLVVKVPLEAKSGELSLAKAPLPAVLHWNRNHFVVVYKISSRAVWIADPNLGKMKLTPQEFNKGFCAGDEKGFALLLETSPDFHATDPDAEKIKGTVFLLQYLRQHRRLIGQLLIGLLLGTVFQLIFPFLTQSLVDVGIGNQNISFIHLVLIGQLVLFASQTLVRFIQSWILLHIGMRINVNLIADFLIKLMKLPLGFFDSKNTGDLMQRIDDHRRIESFLTQSALVVLLSAINLVVFGIVLAIYSGPIFGVFLFSSVLYLGWIFLFLNRRKDVDHSAFQHMADNHGALIEIIHGMPEIKLQGSQLKRRGKWAAIQARLFKTQVKSLAISQYQDAGALSISQLKDIVITFMAARTVIDGEITLGMMLAIQYIIGQLNAPLQQLVIFIRSAQDAFISLERLSEIHTTPVEEKAEEQKIDLIPGGDIAIDNLSFSYTPISEQVLENVSFTIPRGKTTAIVGGSGSGKTTLIKLLLGFYPPSKGKISIGGIGLSSIYQKAWRAQCGVVMQEGFIFSDTIVGNIAESDSYVDYNKIIASADTANIADFIHTLPLGLNTMIGARGNGISQGQKQRLLIARAVYKNPEFLFFDEATNALDATNEKVIMNNLNAFLAGKTAVVVAHRLSTVRNADQIIVLNKGKVVEIGNHAQLVDKKAHYYTLVHNQLELGN